MIKYYTRACNFYYGSISKEKIKKKLSIPLHGNELISFDTIEIISRKNIKRINVKKLNKLEKRKNMRKIKVILQKMQTLKYLHHLFFFQPKLIKSYSTKSPMNKMFQIVPVL